MVRFYESYEHEQYIYMVMEYCPGKQLYDIIKLHNESQMPVYNEKIVSFIAFHLLLALNHIHSLNICHWDLKPENIMIDENWNVKILDFGLANLLQ